MFFQRKPKNEKRYIKQKFHFLIDRGYKLKYYYRNGEELFSYSSKACNIEIINEPECFDVIINYGHGFPYDYSHNIRKVLPSKINTEIADKKIKLFAPVSTIDYFATIVSQNIEEIEHFH